MASVLGLSSWRNGVVNLRDFAIYTLDFGFIAKFSLISLFPLSDSLQFILLFNPSPQQQWSSKSPTTISTPFFFLPLTSPWSKTAFSGPASLSPPISPSSAASTSAPSCMLLLFLISHSSSLFFGGRLDLFLTDSISFFKDWGWIFGDVGIVYW